MSHEQDEPCTTVERIPNRIPVGRAKLNAMLGRIDPRLAREAVAEFFQELPPIALNLETIPNATHEEPNGVVCSMRASPSPGLIATGALSDGCFGVRFTADASEPIQGRSPNGTISWQIERIPGENESSTGSPLNLRVIVRARLPELDGVRLRVLVDGQEITGTEGSAGLVFKRRDLKSTNLEAQSAFNLASQPGNFRLRENSALGFRLTGIRVLKTRRTAVELDVGNDLHACCFSHDGFSLFTGGSNALLHVWDLATGDIPRRLEGHQGPILSCATDGSTEVAVTASSDSTVRVWDLPLGECAVVFEGHRDAVTAVAISLDGSLAVSGSRDGLLLIWSLDSVACIGRLVGHSDEIVAVAFAPDASCLVSASRDKTLRVWDMRTNACRRVMKLDGDGVASLAVSPDGEFAVTGSGKNTLQVWRLDSGQCLQNLAGHADANIGVAFALDGKHVVSGSRDGTVCVWSLDVGDVILRQAAPAGMRSMALLADGLQVAAVLMDGSVWFWDSFATMIASAAGERAEAQLQATTGSTSPDIGTPASQPVAASARTRTTKLKKGLVWVTTVGAAAAAASLVIATTSWSDLTQFFASSPGVQIKGSGAVHGNMYCKLVNQDERVMVGRFAVCPPRTAIRVRAASPPGRWAQVSFIMCNENTGCTVSHSQSIGEESEVTFPLAAAPSTGNRVGWLVWSEKPLEGSAVRGASRELRHRAALQRGAGDARSLCKLLDTPCALFPFSWEVSNRDPDE